jgi:hypothetical protein
VAWISFQRWQASGDRWRGGDLDKQSVRNLGGLRTFERGGNAADAAIAAAAMLCVAEPMNLGTMKHRPAPRRSSRRQ